MIKFSKVIKNMIKMKIEVILKILKFVVLCVVIVEINLFILLWDWYGI